MLHPSGSVRIGLDAVGTVMVAYDLVAVPLRGPSISRTIGIVTRRGHTLSSPAERLARIFREYFQTV